jgi:hypothetical protein
LHVRATSWTINDTASAARPATTLAHKAPLRAPRVYCMTPITWRLGATPCASGLARLGGWPRQC